MISEKDLIKYTFTTGAFITPFYRKDIDKWIWVVSEFKDDTFCDGKCISPSVSANSISELNSTDDEFEIGTEVDVSPNCE